MSCSSGRADINRSRLISFVALFALLVLSPYASAAEAPWSAVGPDGGDARAFAAVPGQPDHIYLGTTTSWIYESSDGGATWHRLARLDSSDDLVLDNIVVDEANSSTVYAAGFKPDRPAGGLWVSHDAGKSWSEVAGLHGQAIYAFIQAPSDAKMLFAGTLQGVYRSADAGATWEPISPGGSHEIHEVESLAVDPKNPEIIYAGTWHLPWKTTDGGKFWHNIKKGLIDDSDVFSIVVDPAQPKVVYLSACSGIYKSESGGELFHKIQGIPSEARRTRVLMQDPTNRNIVYAGTTEGLYKTMDAGRTFRRMTGPETIVNDVYIDPRDTQRVLLATDRGGVQASTDAGANFSPSNTGFSARKVEALLVDRKNPSRLYAGVVNDKEFGGVFVSNNGGAEWQHIGQGLEGRDVYSLAETQEGDIVAGTSHGIFVKPAAGGSVSPSDQSSSDQGSSQGSSSANSTDAASWQARNTIANTSMKAAVETVHGKRIDIEKSVKDKLRELDSRVNALDVAGDVWLAATGDGLLTSRDKGDSWQGGPVMGAGDYLSVAAQGTIMIAAAPDRVVISEDGGRTWSLTRVPAMLTRIHRVAFSGDGTLWIGAREGVYYSKDKGKTWWWIERLPMRDIDDLHYDAKLDRVLVSSRASDQIFSIDPKSLSWKWWQTGYRVALIRVAGDRLLAASLYDGVVRESQPAEGEASRQ